MYPHKKKQKKHCLVDSLVPEHNGGSLAYNGDSLIYDGGTLAYDEAPLAYNGGSLTFDGDSLVQMRILSFLCCHSCLALTQEQHMSCDTI